MHVPTVDKFICLFSLGIWAVAAAVSWTEQINSVAVY